MSNNLLKKKSNFKKEGASQKNNLLSVLSTFFYIILDTLEQCGLNLRQPGTNFQKKQKEIGVYSIQFFFMIT